VYFWNEITDIQRGFFDFFETNYNGKVDYSVIAWDQLDIRVLTDISSGTSPDLVFLHDRNFPRVVIQQLIAPLSSLNQELVNHPVLADNNVGIRNYFSWGGEQYAVSGSANRVLTFFNKTLFEDLDMKNPLDHYNEGTWNFDTFRELAMAACEDTTDSGTFDRYGFGSWKYELFPMANGGNFVQYTADGSIRLTLDDPKLVLGLEFMQDGYFKDKFIHPDGNLTWETDFTTGKMAMVADSSYIISRFVYRLRDEWDFVPFPLGPDNDGSQIPATVNASGISATARNPDGALYYLIAQHEYGQTLERYTEYRPFLSEEQLERLYQYENDRVFLDNVSSSRYQGIGDMWNKQWNFWFSVFAGTPIATAVSAFEPIFQAEINIALADNKPPEFIPFEPLPKIDFEDGSLDWVTDSVTVGGITDSWGNERFELIDRADAIEGTSLLITRDHSEDWQFAFATNHEKWFIPAFGHTYEVSFDYKMLSDMSAEGFFFVSLRPPEAIWDDLVSFGETRVSGLRAGDTGTFRATIAINLVTNPLVLYVGGFQNGDMVIDNITIEKVN
jgi:ABC-type glycerol-3-phosphate transport system substrate-binding protein